jgi:hypothetical protein
MKADPRRRRVLVVGVVLMLAALFFYIASLDDSDPDALPASVERSE